MAQLSDTQLNDINRHDSNDEEKYIKDTAYKQQDLATEEVIERGTIYISEEYAKQAVMAIKNRVEDEDVKAYTDKRIRQINDNYEAYENDAIVKSATHQTYIPETRNSIQDWMDDLDDIFRNLPESIEVEAKDNISDRHLTVKMQGDESDEEGPKKFFLSALKKIIEQEKENIEVDEAMALDSVLKEPVYYFNLLSTVKQFLIDGLEKADYEKKITDLLEKGLVTGMFVVKSTYDQKNNRALKVFENNDKKGYGKYIEEVEKESIYNFEVIDAGNLIFRQDKLDWIIERINTNFWAILNTTLNESNKPKKNTLYCYEMLKSVEEKVFISQAPDTRDGRSDNLSSESESVGEFNDVKKLDGDIEVLEGHMIPIRYKVKDLLGRKEGKRFKNISKDSEITLPSVVVCIFADDQYYPIRIQPEPTASPYKIGIYAKKRNDVSGMGLPEILKSLQDVINTNYNLFQDLLDMALKGVTAINEDKIDNPEVLDGLQAGTNIKIKDAAGMTINEIIQIFRPDLGSLGAMLRVFELLAIQIKRTSRKGATGEKIEPNPSATEAFNIIKELEKSVFRTGMVINNIFKDVLKDMYIYTLLNRKNDFQLKLSGYKLGMKNVLNPLTNIEEQISEQIRVSKWVEVTPQEIYVDGISFKIKALENAKKESLTNQQLLQFLRLVNEMGMVTNPDGTPKVFVDDTGSQVKIDIWGLVDNLAKSLDQKKVWKKVTQEEMSPTQLTGAPVSASSGAPGQIPPLTKQGTQTTADLLRQGI